MKLTKTITEVRVEKSYPGLLEMEAIHEIKSTKASLNWIGPKIDPVAWAEVLAFFKWVNTSTQSEAQVRGYVNLEENRWAFWAYPQKACSGMSAQELDTPERDEQRRQFPEDKWIYINTTHSHCNMSAFQSSTDEQNEKDQTGLHITIGHLNQSTFDFHARFYLNGLCFQPDMSLFWDVGDSVRALLPDGLLDTVARYQMSKVSDDQTFPNVWRTNIVEVKKVQIQNQFTPWHGNGDWNKTRQQRERDAAIQVVKECLSQQYTHEEIITFAKWLDSSLVGKAFAECKSAWMTAAEMAKEIEAISKNGWCLGDAPKQIQINQQEQDRKDALDELDSENEALMRAYGVE